MAEAKLGSVRGRLLAAATELFYDRGVSATGIDSITAAAGVAKMSLYNNFSSKDELVSAYLQARHEEWLGLYRSRLEAAGADPRAGVGAVFEAYIDHAEMAYRNGFRGCGLLNAAAELPAGAAGREIVRRHKEEVQAIVAGHLTGLGSLTADGVDEMAMQLSLLLEGSMSRAGLEGDSRLVHRAKSLAMAVVGNVVDQASELPR